MKQTNSLSSKDENMSSENGAAGLTQDQLLFTENIYASLPMSIEVYDANGSSCNFTYEGWLYRSESMASGGTMV